MGGILLTLSDIFLEDAHAGSFLSQCSIQLVCGGETIYAPEEPQFSSVVLFDEQD